MDNESTREVLAKVNKARQEEVNRLHKKIVIYKESAEVRGKLIKEYADFIERMKSEGKITKNDLSGIFTRKKLARKMHWKEEKLLKGEKFMTKEKGNSMEPLISSGQEHELSPCKWTEVEPGDIVFCKVKGSYYTHLVKAKDEKRGVLIGNNRGKTNGWTSSVFGKVTKIIK